MAKFSHACYKHFGTRAQAEPFISDWIEMFARVAKDNIMKSLLKGHRPMPEQVWSLRFEWQEDPQEVEQELMEGVSRLRLRG